MEAAPTVATDPATDIEDTSFTANLTVSGGGNVTSVTERGFAWIQGSTGTPETSDNNEFETGDFGNDFSWGTTINSLEPETDYRVRAYAINSVGTTYGDTITVTTAEATNQPPDTPTITNPAADATVGGSVSLEATVTDPDGDDVRATWELWSAGTLGDVLDSFSTPGFNAQGLTWDGTNLWNAELNAIYKLDPSNGNVLDSFSPPVGNARGLTWDGTNLWHAKTAPNMIYKLDPSDGTVLDSFSSPGSAPDGLAWDGTNLWNADNNTNTIYKLDPANGNVLDSFSSPGTSPRGLTWDGTNLWNADSASPRTIYKLDPANGNVLDSFLSPGGNPRGLAWDGTNLWNADPSANTIYKLNVPSLVQAIPENETPVTSGTTHTTSWDSTAVDDGDYELRAWAVDEHGLQSSEFDSRAIAVEAGVVDLSGRSSTSSRATINVSVRVDLSGRSSTLSRATADVSIPADAITLAGRSSTGSRSVIGIFAATLLAGRSATPSRSVVGIHIVTPEQIAGRSSTGSRSALVVGNTSISLSGRSSTSSRASTDVHIVAPEQVAGRSSTGSRAVVAIGFGDFNPLNLAVIIDESTAHLTWDPSPGDVIDYQVFRRTPQTGEPFDPVTDEPVAVGVPAVAEPSYDDTGLDAADYDWQVFGRVRG